MASAKTEHLRKDEDLAGGRGKGAHGDHGYKSNNHYGKAGGYVRHGVPDHINYECVSLRQHNNFDAVRELPSGCRDAIAFSTEPMLKQ